MKSDCPDRYPAKAGGPVPSPILWTGMSWVRPPPEMTMGELMPAPNWLAIGVFSEHYSHEPRSAQAGNSVVRLGRSATRLLTLGMPRISAPSALCSPSRFLANVSPKPRATDSSEAIYSLVSTIELRLANFRDASCVAVARLVDFRDASSLSSQDSRISAMPVRRALQGRGFPRLLRPVNGTE